MSPIPVERRVRFNLKYRAPRPEEHTSRGLASMDEMQTPGRVVVVGSMNIDMITYCDRFPDDGETLVGSSYAQGFGGKGANQAVMASRLGADTIFIGCVGNDDLGRATVANFAKRGVDASGVKALDDHSTGVAPIWVNRDGANRILIVPGANDALSGDHVAEHLADTDGVAVVVGQLETPQSATLAGFRWAKSHGAATVLNPAPAAGIVTELMDVTDWIVPNETEFALLTGVEPSDDAAETWATIWGCGVIITLGGDGVLVADGVNRSWRQPAASVNVIDTTGAGDAFVGGFAAGLASGMSLTDAVALGGACGSLSTTKEGTQLSYPDASEVMVLNVEVPTW